VTRRRAGWLLLPAGAVVALAVVTRFRTPEGPPYATARSIVNRHCLGCHSEHPTIPAFPLAPKEIELDTAEEMQRHAALILTTVAESRSMPLLNKTGMTEEERVLLADWVRAGARIQERSPER
jgi:uncharacterized membrane protein